MKIHFAVTLARSATSMNAVWTHIEVDIHREFDFDDAAQCRELLRRLRSARNLFFEEKEEQNGEKK